MNGNYIVSLEIQGTNIETNEYDFCCEDINSLKREISNKCHRKGYPTFGWQRINKSVVSLEFCNPFNYTLGRIYITEKQCVA